MATISKAKKVPIEDNICQGDVFKNVRYAYIDVEDNETVQIVEYEFPMAIIVSQACDVISMADMVEKKGGKSTKFMPAILLCPIYDVEVVKNAEHLSNVFNELKIKKLDSKDDRIMVKDDVRVAEKDWHYRFHDFSVSVDNECVLEKAVIDFKHYFTVPASYLMKNRDNRMFEVEDIYAEQITLKFSTYLSRVAMPSE